MGVAVGGFDWLKIITLVLSSSVGTALFSQMFGRYLESRKESAQIRRDASYLALRLSVVLEKFAVDCAVSIWEAEDYYSSPGGRSGGARIPELIEYPSDADWKSLDNELSSRALTFCNEIHMARIDSGFTWELDHDDAIKAKANFVGKCGYGALKLSKDLRKKYSIQPFKFADYGWDIEDLLRKKFDRANASPMML